MLPSPKRLLGRLLEVPCKRNQKAARAAARAAASGGRRRGIACWPAREQEAASARASSVLPVPGGPYSSTPLRPPAARGPHTEARRGTIPQAQRRVSLRWGPEARAKRKSSNRGPDMRQMGGGCAREQVGQVGSSGAPLGAQCVPGRGEVEAVKHFRVEQRQKHHLLQRLHVALQAAHLQRGSTQPGSMWGSRRHVHGPNGMALNVPGGGLVG